MGTWLKLFVFDKDKQAWDTSVCKSVYNRSAVPRIGELVFFEDNNHKVVEVIHRIDDSEVWIFLK